MCERQQPATTTMQYRAAIWAGSVPRLQPWRARLVFPTLVRGFLRRGEETGTSTRVFSRRSIVVLRTPRIARALDGLFTHVSGPSAPGTRNAVQKLVNRSPGRRGLAGNVPSRPFACATWRSPRTARGKGACEAPTLLVQNSFLLGADNVPQVLVAALVQSLAGIRGACSDRSAVIGLTRLLHDVDFC